MTIWEKLTLSVLGTFLLAISGFAQSRDRAELGGRVTDETGGTLPGVSLLLHSEATGHEYATVSGDTGDFVFPFVPMGSYTLRADLPGFSRLRIEGIRLSLNQRVELPLVLKVGAVETEITVVTEANRIETTNPTLKDLVTEKELKDMPILIGIQDRGVLDTLTLLTPGASSFLPDGRAGTWGQGISINGSPVAGVGFYLDGIDNTVYGLPGFAVTVGPNPDALGEFSVLTHTYKAEAGGLPALIHLKTKGGGNEFHGEARVINLNPDLSAREFFDAKKKTLWTTNGLGFQLSGPVILPGLYRGRNKTFFFFDLETTRSRFETNVRETVLSDAQRVGDFSDLPKELWPLDPLTGEPFPGGRIPANRVLPQSRFYIDQFVRRANLGNEWVGISRETPGGTQFTTRIDHQFSPSSALTASFFYQDTWWDGRWNKGLEQRRRRSLPHQGHGRSEQLDM